MAPLSHTQRECSDPVLTQFREALSDQEKARRVTHKKLMKTKTCDLPHKSRMCPSLGLCATIAVYIALNVCYLAFNAQMLGLSLSLHTIGLKPGYIPGYNAVHDALFDTDTGDIRWKAVHAATSGAAGVASTFLPGYGSSNVSFVPSPSPFLPACFPFSPGKAFVGPCSWLHLSLHATAAATCISRACRRECRKAMS